MKKYIYIYFKCVKELLSVSKMNFSELSLVIIVLSGSLNQSLRKYAGSYSLHAHSILSAWTEKK